MNDSTQLTISDSGVEMPHETDRLFSLSVFVPGEPKGQPRPRAFAAGGKARVYTPGTAEAWKSEIARALEPYVPGRPLTGPLSAELLFVMPRPKSHYRTGKFAGLLKDSAPKWHTGRPDVDNLAKAVLDAMATIGLYKEDSQIAKLKVEKSYITVDSFVEQRPGCRILFDDLE